MAEPLVPVPAPDDRTGAFPGMYCACGHPAPCPTHQAVRLSEPTATGPTLFVVAP